MAKTIEQERAAHALKEVQKVKSGKAFISLANGMPTMIHTNGLGQAIAFCKGKKEDKGKNEDKDKEYIEMVAMLSSWLCDSGKPFAGTKPEDILTTITQKEMHTYMRAQVEAMAYLLWVKKFAKALLDKDDQHAAAV